MAKQFFDEPSEQSQVKAAIVAGYFWAWGKVITGYLKGSHSDTSFQYIDLFAGPGRYSDQSKSTPILILERAVNDPLFRDNLTAIFNDKDDANTSTLTQAIKAVPGVETLRHAPAIYANEVGDEIVKMFEKLDLVPTLMFVDPWGYKGLSLKLINSVLKDWACECIFFFNYNRINMGLNNLAVKEHMEALFGQERAAALGQRLLAMSPDKRELTIVEELCEALVEMGGQYIVPFCFKNKAGTRTSHHLVFVSKHPLGYKIMKRIMANESSTTESGVASFAYSPATAEQPLLFGLLRPLGDLEELLLDEFAGRTLSMVDIFNEHNRLTPGCRHKYMLPYTDKNYKDVLTRMEQDGKITGNKPWTARPKRLGEITCADGTLFTFPKKRSTI